MLAVFPLRLPAVLDSNTLSCLAWLCCALLLLAGFLGVFCFVLLATLLGFALLEALFAQFLETIFCIFGTFAARSGFPWPPFFNALSTPQQCLVPVVFGLASHAFQNSPFSIPVEAGALILLIARLPDWK